MKNDFPRLEISPELRRKMIEIAREFRKVPTQSEAILWRTLRGKRLDGIKFRRQQPVGTFVVDFHNSVYRLVVEIDGLIHENQLEVDKARQEILEALGLNVLRIKSEIVENDLHSALDMIRHKIQEIRSHRNVFPSPMPALRVDEGFGEGQGGG